MSVRDDLTALQARVAGILRERDEARGRMAVAEAQARAMARAADTHKAGEHHWRVRAKELEAAVAVAIRHLSLCAGDDAKGTGVRVVIENLSELLSRASTGTST